MSPEAQATSATAEATTAEPTTMPTPTPTPTPTPADRALVLGPGGLVGTAWTAGLAAGLRRAGVDLGEADLIVGTSAGAIVGALLATGQDLDRIATRPQRSPAGEPGGSPVPPRAVDPAVLGAVFAVLGEPGLEPGEARRRVGRIALDHADPDAERMLLAVRGALIGTDAWPARRLLITAVDAASGEPVVWDRTSGVPLVHAVAASSAFPGAEPPVAVGGRRYMDGALRSGPNADLAAGARTLVVVDPMAHRSSPETLERQRAALEAGTVLTIGPDPEAVRAFGTDLGDRTKWEPAYRAGLGQAAATAERLRPAWTPYRGN
ncbi:patatin-like phospholipase family protein [Streptomyces sp. NBC_00536]|uniref:patatin-like phospholipase family protein n=1 Tax=Streptomyces sp. NBC_00536 TaxID=2975769 RepID=UPI002E803A77|nr:patatin-like phospholipase family protein [Streptomyces sp. NBC_00536]WUC82906.1 patatin-like phospholipase family protein [Streptomyces sp. NBC_00536]